MESSTANPVFYMNSSVPPKWNALMFIGSTQTVTTTSPRCSPEIESADVPVAAFFYSFACR